MRRIIFPKGNKGTLAILRPIDRRTGKSYVRGIRQRAHKVISELSTGSSVRFIHQYENILARVDVRWYSLEFVNHGDDETAPIA